MSLFSFGLLLCLKFIGIISFAKIKTIKIGDYVLPDWTFYIGESMQILVLTGLFGGAVIQIIKNKFIGEMVRVLYTKIFFIMSLI